MLNINKFTCNPSQENTYILSDETGEAVIVDCGVYYPNERRRLLEYIEEEQLHPVRLLLTHAHHDHVYGNDLIHDNFGLLPEVHKAEKQMMTERLQRRIDVVFNGKYPFRIPMPEQYLIDNEIVFFGSHELQVIHTPGHTPGSIFLYCEEEGIALSGDTLFYRSIGRSDLPGGDERELHASLKYITELLPDDTKIYPGHYKSSTLEYEKEHNPFLI